jgi:flagellar biosynthesis/type III secretory pathway protein FliH
MLRHWNEEQRMADIEYPPVRQALGKIRALSADEEAKRLAFVSERAIRDEKSALSAALKKGLARGLTKGKQEGLLEGKRAQLHRLISRKFTTLPAPYLQQLDTADNDQLDEWADRILTALTLDELFSSHTP